VGTPCTVFYILVISDEIFHVIFLALCCMNKIYLELEHIPSTRFLMNYVANLMCRLTNLNAIIIKAVDPIIIPCILIGFFLGMNEGDVT
jgi:hypothetical protein